ncbi:hypothetical protein [Adhaeribacter aquaticus]|uniref:hypothetical protein n=1 Tax=Adhaeribacter aquaticus TaxID=299567 RepID=UPI0004216C15|nr:hypothetical protein [Adhaeribacter aquaticus]
MNELSDKDGPKKLEDIFRAGMEEAEVSPSDRLWSRIEQNLDSKETKLYKEKLVWYQTLVAACITLVVCAGAFLFYDYNNERSHTRNLIANQPVKLNTPVENNQRLPKAKTEIQSGLAIAGNTTKVPVTQEGRAIKAPNTDLEEITKWEATTVTSTNISEKTKSVQPPLLNSNNDKKVLALAEKNSFSHSAVALPNNPENNIDFTGALGSGQEANKEVLSDAFLDSRPVVVESNVSSVLPEKLNRVKPIMPKRATTNYLAMTEEPEKKRTPRWSVISKYSPHYFNQNIALATNNSSLPASSVGFAAPASNAGLSSYSSAMQEFDNNTKPQYSYSAAMGAGYQLTSNWSLETGLAFTQNTASTESSYIINNNQGAAAKFNSSTRLHDQNSKPEAALPTTALIASLGGQKNIASAQVVKTTSFETQYRYRLLGVPVKVTYQMSRSKSIYYASFGFLTNLLIQTHIFSDSPRVPDLKYGPNSDSPFRGLQMAAVASAGRGFIVTKGLSLRAGIEATQYMTSLVAQPDNLEFRQRKPYNIGFSLSSTYTLGK